MHTPDDYRFHLIEAIQSLNDCDLQLFNAGINLLMKGELSDVDDAFDIGDTYEFHIALLETSKDPSVQIILNALLAVRNAAQSLKAIHEVKDEEMPDDDEEDDDDISDE